MKFPPFGVLPEPSGTLTQGRVATAHIYRSKLAGIAPGIDQPNHHVAPCWRKVENGSDDLACPKHDCAEQHRWMNASPAPEIPRPHGDEDDKDAPEVCQPPTKWTRNLR